MTEPALPPRESSIDPLAAQVIEAVRKAAERLAVFDKPAFALFNAQVSGGDTSK